MNPENIEIAKVLIFWTMFFVLFYSFFGYGIFLWFLVHLRKLVTKKSSLLTNENFRPEVTLVIASYNEEKFIAKKISNSLELDYPENLLKILIVTDGSDDHTPQIVQSIATFNPRISHYHESERKGKLHAVDRIYPFIDSPIIVFSDANTILNKDAISKIVRHYVNPEVGGVSGEKRIDTVSNQKVAGIGEGFYWKYESFLKRLEHEFYSLVGAAGEIFSIRTALYVYIPKDSIIEDFFLTMKVAEKGYRVAYEPEAYAMETGSSSTREELKRKIRISAGGIQSVIRLKSILNPFKHGWLTFEYVSHRVLRWTIAPWLMIALFLMNLLIYESHLIYKLLLYGQLLFYLLAFVGYILQFREIKWKPFFVPYYFCMMNYAVIRGLFRYLSGRQSMIWERAQRA